MAYRKAVGHETDLSRDFTRGRMFMSHPREVSKEFYGIRPAIRGWEDWRVRKWRCFESAVISVLALRWT